MPPPPRKRPRPGAPGGLSLAKHSHLFTQFPRVRGLLVTAKHPRFMAQAASTLIGWAEDVIRESGGSEGSSAGAGASSERDKKNFRIYDTGSAGRFFLGFGPDASLPKPSVLVDWLLRDPHLKERGSRFVSRIVPVDYLDVAAPDQFSVIAESVFADLAAARTATHTGDPLTWKAVVEVRSTACGILCEKDAIVLELNRAQGAKLPEATVDLIEPEVLILVDAFKSAIAISAVSFRSYRELAKYNVAQLLAHEIEPFTDFLRRWCANEPSPSMSESVLWSLQFPSIDKLALHKRASAKKLISTEGLSFGGVKDDCAVTAIARGAGLPTFGAMPVAVGAFEMLESGQICFLRALAVRREFRRCGLATRLLHEMIHRGQQAKVVAVVVPPFVTAVFTRFGFLALPALSADPLQEASFSILRSVMAERSSVAPASHVMMYLSPGWKLDAEYRLLAQDGLFDGSYSAPSLPMSLQSLTMDLPSSETPFGAEWRKMFSLDFPPSGDEAQVSDTPSVVYLNHGAFGATPRFVFESKIRWAHECEKNPTGFFRSSSQHMVHSLRLASKLLNCSPADIVFQDNATSAMSTILASFPFTHHDDKELYDEVICLDLSFHSVLEALSHWAPIRGFAVRHISSDLISPATAAFSASGLVDLFTASVSMRTRLVIVDAIHSSTGLIVPLYHLVESMHAKGIAVLVDGAHAMGQIPVDLLSLKPDFFVTNVHKWCFAPRGCALMYVNPKFQKFVAPLSISEPSPYAGLEHGEVPSKLTRSRWNVQFLWTGTRDLSNFLACASAISFFTAVDNIRPIMKHNHELAVRGAARIASILDSRLAPGQVADSSEATEWTSGAMCSVVLPFDRVAPGTLSNRHLAGTEGARLDAWLRSQRPSIVAAVKLLPDGRWVLRVCAQIYNCDDDFIYLGERTAAFFDQA